MAVNIRVVAIRTKEAAAPNAAEKARAAYSRARFLFHQRHLVLYNGALWEGWRVWALEIHGPNDLLSMRSEPGGTAAAWTLTAVHAELIG